METLRRLTGGIPRTMILLFEIFVDESANIFEDLELILDHITPLYKHRLAWLFFKNIRNRAEALQLAARSVEISKNADNTHSLAVCLLWHDRYNESVEMFFDCLEFDPFDRLESDITFYLIFLLAKKQHHLLLQLFKDERYQLKERFKPVYYALMHRMQDEFPKEYLKMGGELRQTVEEILAEADKMTLNYQI